MFQQKDMGNVVLFRNDNDNEDKPSNKINGPWGKKPSKNDDRDIPRPWSAHSNGSKKRPSSGNGSGDGNIVDQIVDQIQQKMRKTLSGGGPKMPSKSPIPWWGFVLTGLALWMTTGLYRVQEGEVGVVMQFGKMNRQTPPGWHYHLPTPLESVLIIKVNNSNFINSGGKNASSQNASDDTLILTGDENMIHANYTVQWKIKNVEEFLFTARDPQETIRVAAESVIREVIGQTTAFLVLTKDRDKIESKAQELLQKLMDFYQLGVMIVTVNLQNNVTPPAQVVDAFNDLQAALNDEVRLKNEGESYRNDIIPRAEGEAYRIISVAQAYGEQATREAKGEAARFTSIVRAYDKNPPITKRRLYFDTMQQVLSKSPKIVLDTKVGKSTLPYLPLPNLPPPIDLKPLEKK